MHVRILSIALVLALAAFAAPAAAQGSGQMTIHVLELPPDPVPLRAGQGQSFTASVNTIISDYVCALGASFDVQVAISSAAQAPPGVAATVDPAAVTFSISSGTYGAVGDPVPGDTPYNESESFSISVTTEPTTPSGPVTLSVTANYPGGAPTPNDPGGVGCGADLPSASGTADLVLDIQGTGTGGPGGGGPGNDTGGNGTGNNTGEPPGPGDGEGGNGLPGFGPMALLSVAGAVAGAMRRRRPGA